MKKCLKCDFDLGLKSILFFIIDKKIQCPNCEAIVYISYPSKKGHWVIMFLMFILSFGSVYFYRTNQPVVAVTGVLLLILIISFAYYKSKVFKAKD